MTRIFIYNIENGIGQKISKDKDILFFLYGEEIFNTEFENYVDKLEDDEDEMRMRYYDSIADTSWADSEMEYIMNNGGDWITY